MLSLKNFALVGLLGSLATVSHADLMSEFSITNGNPNGAWSYGTKISTTGTFVLANTSGSGSTGTANYDSWSFSGVPFLSANKLTSGTLNGFNGGNGGISVGEVFVHPSENNDLAVVRYTVSTAGLYDLSGYFGAGDGVGTSRGRIDAYVYKNNSSLFTVLDTAVTETFALTSVALAVGDTVDVMVGMGSDAAFYDSTPVNLSLTPVPEPATIAGLGLALAAFAKRRRK